MTCEKSQYIRIILHRPVSHTPSMVVNIKECLSDQPQFIDCPYCKVHSVTEVKFIIDLFTWISFITILRAGVFILPLFFLWYHSSLTHSKTYIITALTAKFGSGAIDE
uniref:LITAF domain-containing protein n=1 Tax=Elaeophora elaphi TaxID=1147741 RepID=A0A0R3RVN5_9BILA